jgi:osmotically-inducible protein OsmY
VQHDFEQRGNRGRGESDRGGYTQRNDFDQRNEDRDYERTFGNYGESSGEFDPRQRRPQGSSGADRARMTDRERYADQQRHDRYSDEMRGFDISPDDWSGEQSGRRTSNRGYDDNRSSRGGGYQQRSSGRSGSPYDRGEIGSWYGGDSGMGDAGSSLSGRQHDRGQYGQGQFDRGQRDRGQFGWDTPSQRQASSQYGQRPFDQDQNRDRFGGERFGGSSGMRQSTAHPDSAHSIEGPFTGRGPRGYQRSDERIYEDVCELLTRHGDIDANQMEVEVHNGVVDLRGTADSGRVRRLTEEVVEDVSGVRDVRNDLRVNQRTGYSEAQPADTNRSERGHSETDRFESGRSSAGHSETGRHDWERTETGRTETGAIAMRPGSTQTGGQTQHAQTIGGTQTGGRFNVREAMDVVGSDGVMVGRVKETRSNDFLVDRSMQRDLYVPFSAIQTVDGDRVMLNIAARDLDRQGWQTPDLAGASQRTTPGS